MPNFKAKQLIHREGPYCVAVDPAVLSEICSYCLHWKICVACECNVVFYCSDLCKEKDTTDHEIECQISRNAGNIIEVLSDSEIRLVIRALARNYREQQLGALSEGTFFQSRRSILQLKTHLEELAAECRVEVQQKARLVAAHMRSYVEVDVFEACLMLQRMRINMFQLSDHKATVKGLACYLGVSIVDHTCERSDDFSLAFNGRDIVLIALRGFSVASVSDFRINYIDPTISYEKRHQMLMDQYYFDCRCNKCQREASDLQRGSDEVQLNESVVQQVENLFSARCTNSMWLQKGIKLLKKMRGSSDWLQYRQDLYVQLQSAAINLKLYRQSLKYGIKALRGEVILCRIECPLVSLCRATKALGWAEVSHKGNAIYRRLVGCALRLLRLTYGDDYPLIDELQSS